MNTQIPAKGLDRLTAQVDLGAIAHNVRVAAQHAPTAAVMAVLKADAYGHGALPVARAVLAGHVRLQGVFTHLAHADQPEHPFLDVQRDVLTATVADARAHGLTPVQVHAANSAATLTRPDLHFDLVRPGIALYGGIPVP